MIRTLEAACNNNILHPVLLHKPLFLLCKFRNNQLGVIFTARINLLALLTSSENKQLVTAAAPDICGVRLSPYAHSRQRRYGFFYRRLAGK